MYFRNFVLYINLVQFLVNSVIWKNLNIVTKDINSAYPSVCNVHTMQLHCTT